MDPRLTQAEDDGDCLPRAFSDGEKGVGGLAICQGDERSGGVWESVAETTTLEGVGTGPTRERDVGSKESNLQENQWGNLRIQRW